LDYNEEQRALLVIQSTNACNSEHPCYYLDYQIARVHKENPMPRVVHFEIPAQDPGKIAAFYNEVFGWEITKWEGGGEPYWLVKTGEDGTLGITHPCIEN
jgi:hypothetical protein